MQWDSLWRNLHAATMMPGAPYGAVEHAAIAVRDGRVAWIGHERDLPRGTQARAEHDLGGAWVTPGLIDCHTHLVFGGDRSDEFEMRLNGAGYEEIARAGGGIMSTVRATRASGREQLVEGALTRLDQLLAEGVTMVEVKSGYGLARESELEMLRAARELANRRPVTVATTCLAAHALPPEHAGARERYIDLVCSEILPAVRRDGLADAVDAFCERIAFTPEETARVFRKARELGLAVKLHADQLSDGGGAALAARFGALSADHLEYTSAEGVEAMAGSGTVAVLLPGAFVMLHETQRPPVEAFRRRGVPMALATDCNPGTSPALSLRLMMTLGCLEFAMTPEEALAGVTVNAARALGVAEQRGTLAPGRVADFAVWEVARPAELAYWLGGNPCRAVVRDGMVVRGRAGR